MNARRLLWLTLLLMTAGAFVDTPGVADVRPPQYASFGGGAYAFDADGPPISDLQRRRVQTEIARNVRQLGLGPTTFAPTRVVLSWPLQAANGLTDYGYHGVSGFVDHDPAYPDRLLDYNCGDRTYDTGSGYNHKGTDFFTWPFAWNKMDRDQVQVIAAADGVIVYKEDGNYDRNCGFGGGDANLVALLHDDGSTAWYLHLKNGSLTSKGLGASVSVGEPLGVVGSSGNSTGPHLHLELYDWQDGLVDPYLGACNGLNAQSWWGTQPPYYDSAVNKLTTGSAPPSFPDCPNPEVSHEKTAFFLGQDIYFTTYYRDQRAGQVSQYAIYRPDATVYRDWTYSMTVDHYAASYWYWSYVLAGDVPTGTWRFEVSFNGATYEHPFEILDLPHKLYLPVVDR